MGKRRIVWGHGGFQQCACAIYCRLVFSVRYLLAALSTRKPDHTKDSTNQLTPLMKTDFRSPFGVCSVSVQGSFGFHSGSFRANFRPKFSEPKIKIFQKIRFVRPSPPRRGPSGWRGSGQRLEGPRRGGDGGIN